MSALRNILMDRKQKSDRLAGIDSPSKVGTPVRTSQANNKGKNKTAYDLCLQKEGVERKNSRR